MDSKMHFILYSPVKFEEWCWTNCDTGIGGSETSHIQMAKELAKRGHTVTSYVPLPPHVPSGAEWEGTQWYRIEDVDWNLPGCWVIYRDPPALDNFSGTRHDQVLWLLFQDWVYETLTPERVAKLDRAVILCKAHEDYLLQKCPELKGLTWITRNAIRLPLIEEVEAEGLPPRNLQRMMYASSPDRGLRSSLLVYQRAKEYVPNLELHVTYGYTNIRKLIAMGHQPGAHPRQRQSADNFERDMNECLALVEKTGAVFHDRLSQRELYREWFKTSVLIYISDFFETGWITGIEGQAMGAIPVFTPCFAQGENTKHGIGIYGAPDDPRTIAMAAAEVAKLCKDTALQEEIRIKMMADVRAKWDWSQFAWKKPNENWETAAQEDFEKKKNTVSAQLSTDPESQSRDRWLHLTSADTFVDIGCGDGDWSVAAAQQGSTVIAVDMVARWKKLDENVEKAGLSDQVRVVEAFVFNQQAGKKKVGRGNEIVKIDVVTVDSLCLVDNIKPTFVRINVGGCELEVLQGARGILTRDKPKLVIEVHEQTVPGVSVSLESVTKFLDSLDLGYVYEPVELQYNGRKYYHLFASVPIMPNVYDEANLSEEESRKFHETLEAGTAKVKFLPQTSFSPEFRAAADIEAKTPITAGVSEAFGRAVAAAHAKTDAPVPPSEADAAVVNDLVRRAEREELEKATRAIESAFAARPSLWRRLVNWWNGPWHLGQ